MKNSQVSLRTTSRPLTVKCRSETSQWKNWFALEKRDKMAKLGWEIRLEMQRRNLRQQANMIRQEKKVISVDKEEKIQRQQKTQHEEINQKVLAKEGRLKRYCDWSKQYKQHRTFQNFERKYKQQIGGGSAKKIPQPNTREAKHNWSKIWEWRDHKKRRTNKQYWKRVPKCRSALRRIYTLVHSLGY